MLAEATSWPDALFGIAVMITFAVVGHAFFKYTMGNGDEDNEE